MGVTVAVAVCVGVRVATGVADAVGVPVGVGVGPEPVTATLSRMAAPRTGLLWLVTARPTKTLADMGIVSEPTRVQVTPSAEREAVKVLPARTILTQEGATTPAMVVDAEIPPAATRRWKDAPWPGVRTIEACAEPGASVSRIITPALAQTFVFRTLVTRATTVPSPLSGW